MANGLAAWLSSGLQESSLRIFGPPPTPDFLIPRRFASRGVFRGLWGGVLCGVLRLSPLCGRFRSSASLAIPHHKSFAAIPSVSLVLFGHTNRVVSLSHESKHEIAGAKMAGTNDFASFSWKIIWTKRAENYSKMPSSQYRYEDFPITRTSRYPRSSEPASLNG